MKICILKPQISNHVSPNLKPAILKIDYVNSLQAWASSLGPSKCDPNPAIGCTGSATVATIVAHIEHIKRIAGVESVGFGADFDGIGVIPSDASSVASYPAVITVHPPPIPTLH